MKPASNITTVQEVKDTVKAHTYTSVDAWTKGWQNGSITIKQFATLEHSFSSVADAFGLTYSDFYRWVKEAKREVLG
jgi:transposase-like protein